jgi:putative Holliday junction resolvase
MIIPTLQEFYQFFQVGKPVIAIDYGSKKTGIAMSCPLHRLAMPIQVIHSISLADQIKQLLLTINYRLPCAIVIGLPINMDGTESQQSNIVRGFAAALAARTLLPIFLQDERLTSKMADNFLKNFGLTRKQRSEQEDLTAASMILETILESVKRLT